VIVPPFGWQEVAARRGLRSWAAALAEAGHPCVRLDLPSTGDSAGSPDDPDRLEAWIESVGAVARRLGEETGAPEVIALGLGLGGLVAVAAAAAGAPLGGLILWGVPDRGRALLRELRAHHGMVAEAFADDVRDAADGEGIELTGYRLSAQTAAGLQQLTLSALSLPGGGRQALLLGREGAEPDAKLAEHLRDGGWAVETAPGDGFAALQSNPQDAAMPRPVIATVERWLERVPSLHDRSEQEGPAGRRRLGESRDRSPLRCHHDGVELTETALWVPGARGRNLAVLTEPLDGERAPAAVALLGAGALWHAGPNRTWVQFSRRWAARGIATVRIDLAGLGESDGDDSYLLTDASFYEPWRDNEVRELLDALQARGTADRFIVGGLCSGAYQGLRRALVDDRVVGLLLLNLYAVRFTLGLVAERALRNQLGHHVPRGEGRALSLPDLVRLAGVARPDLTWRALRRSAERGQRRETLAALDALRDRQVETLLLLAEAEPFLSQIERLGIPDQLERWPNLAFERVPSRDHMFRAAWLQREVSDALDGGVRRALDRLAAVERVTAGSVR
jgi:pimeloyl-ACP methyl ester carboxylesterase